MHCSNILDTLGRRLTGLKLYLEYLSPFLKTEVISACFSSDENSELVMDILKLHCKMLAKMSTFSLIILEGISLSWRVLETSWFKTSLSISSLSTSENEKAACFFPFYTSPIVSILGSFPYFTINLIIGSLVLSEERIVCDIFRDIKAAHIVWQKAFKTWAVSSWFETISFLI